MLLIPISHQSIQQNTKDEYIFNRNKEHWNRITKNTVKR